MSCQTEIANKIREQEADYILQVKNNQKTLLENSEDSFAVKKVVEIDTTEDCGHELWPYFGIAVMNKASMQLF
jgi:hypothetical protein